MKKDKENRMTIKIMMIGEQAVGKSSITKRYIEHIFLPNIMGTAGLDMKQKIVNIYDEEINVIIYDSAGHERFRKITELQYKGSDGLVLIYDITDQKSFEWIIEWIDKLRIDNSPNNNMEIILLGNKIDLEGRMINIEKVQEIADKYKIKLLETSALSGHNINEAFDYMIKKIYDSKLKQLEEKIKKEKELSDNENKTENATENNLVNANRNTRINMQKKKNICCMFL